MTVQTMLHEMIRSQLDTGTPAGESTVRLLEHTLEVVTENEYTAEEAMEHLEKCRNAIQGAIAALVDAIPPKMTPPVDENATEDPVIVAEADLEPDLEPDAYPPSEQAILDAGDPPAAGETPPATQDNTNPPA